MSESPVAILSKLVSFRSDVVGGAERPIAEHLAGMLRARHADEVVVGDVPRQNGKAASYVYARFGKPKLLINAHLDTVPPNADWTSDPFTARIDNGRLYALGASDTKGAAAAILAALDRRTPRDTAVLFSGDEEYSSTVMQMFVGSPMRSGLERAIVCEPTNLAVGTRHRGFVAFEVDVSCAGGHSSRADTMPSPIGMLARLAVRFDDWAIQHRTVGPPGFPGMCLNLAKLDGGVAFNVIPAHAKLTVSIRPPPGADTNAICEELRAMIREVIPSASAQFLRANSPFQTRDLASFRALGSQTPIDLGFWTEAALLSSAGVDAIVMGPGDIAEAHAPNEWVAIEELDRARDLFVSVFENT